MTDDLVKRLTERLQRRDDRIEELEAKLKRARDALRIVHLWAEDLEIYAWPAEPLGPAFKKVGEVLEELECTHVSAS